jgi:hypothetical protein
MTGGVESMPGHILPENPSDFIKKCVTEGKILWTYHVNMRMKGRHIARSYIIEATNTYEVIESYPEDKYLPSYLVYANNNNILFHVLFAADIEDDNVRIVTVYEPNPLEWDEQMKIRRG